MARADRRLLEQFHALPEDAQGALLEYLDFLYRKHAATARREAPSYVPIARPESESVVGAMQRLRQSYSMLNMDDLLHRASGLMSQHVVGGRSAAEVIDELEELFHRSYLDFRSKGDDTGD
ncbi:MAG: hypothetical protein DWQ08_15800 [Proteobacteria bacterium]|nr:MAG: hypothetical protein DWQ08_15800 [Pseudomonadota bacterium]